MSDSVSLEYASNCFGKDAILKIVMDLKFKVYLSNYLDFLYQGTVTDILNYLWKVITLSLICLQT